jgi:large subunit ribosomal protein L19
MPTVMEQINAKYKKHAVVDVHSGDTVRVHQKIKEGNKERIQVFEGLVIRTDRKGSHTSSITVRRLASGIGVEKTYLVHSPLVTKIEITKRSKVRRKYLSYMRNLTGKSARLSGVDFDKTAVNTVPEEEKKAEAPKDEAVKEEAPAKVEETVEKKEEPKADTAKEEKTDDKKEG